MRYSQIIAEQVLVEGEIVPAKVTINENGVISKIEKLDNSSSSLNEENGETILRLNPHQVLLPGVVDSHVHINEPGRTEWEGFESATAAAAVGGVTTVADMPLNSIPPTTTSKNLQAKLDAAKDKCHIDCAFIGGVVSDNQKDLLQLLNDGVVGFKCFLIHSGVDEFTCVSVDQLEEALSNLSSVRDGRRGFLMFHAEVEIEEPADLGSKDGHKYQTFLESRPREMENRAIELVIRVCKKYNYPCHIVHLSSSDALPMIKKAKEEGVLLTVETCYHYLFFQSEDIPDSEPKNKCCPPIREGWNREKLWEGLIDGTIDMVVSDHSPCTADLKAKNGGDYMASWGGISSVQFGLSILFTEALKRGISLAQLSKWVSQTTSKLIGLDGRKGKIREGMDADFVVFDPLSKYVVQSSNTLFKNKLSAYEGKELNGVVEKTILRGELIAEKGKIVSDGKKGRRLLANKKDI